MQLVFEHRGPAAHHSVSDGRRRREIVAAERVGNQPESDRARRQRRRLVHQLAARRILDPELSQIGADAVHRAFKEAVALVAAGFVNGEFDRRRTAIQNQNRQR